MAEEPVAPLVEREVALDIVKRGLMISPLVVLGAGLAFGWVSASFTTGMLAPEGVW